MAKKKKKNLPEVKVPLFLPCLTGLRRFDWDTLLLAAVIIIISALAATHPYKLSEADPYGFLIWFLLIIGYLPMEIIEFTAKLSGTDGKTIENFIAHREAVLLGLCNLIMLAACWAVMRFYVLKRYGTEPLRTAAIFFRLIFFWGIFQLCCFVAVKNWSDGKVNPLHRELKKPTEIRSEYKK